MSKLKVGVIDLVSQGPKKTLWARVMHANFASIMPQVIATWCDQKGHEVDFMCYTGLENLEKELPRDADVVFISAFTQAAFLAYSLSKMLQAQGAVTVLGGPHARCYPEDACKYFDYVVGFTDEEVLMEILDNCEPQKPVGRHLSAKTQPKSLPSLIDRWKYVEPTLKKAPFLKLIPMIGSMGCPYTCSFCIDSVVKYQPLDFDVMKRDMQFLLTKFKEPWIGWQDPNFGVRFEDYMDAIASIQPRGRVKHIAESSLSILSKDHLEVMKENGFLALLPGIESWYEMGNKSRTSRKAGEEKLLRITEHVNMMFEYVPYVQTNFVLGLDTDEGDEPFELTKRFVDMAPAAFPGYSLLTSFGEAAPLNLEYQREKRVLPFPFHFLNNNQAMNLKPKNYEWIEFYDKVIDLTAYTFSRKAIYRRLMNTPHWTARYLNFIRAISAEGYGRIRFYKTIRKQLLRDTAFRDFFEGESEVIPEFYVNIIKRDLGALWSYLPEGAIYHNPNAYLEKQKSSAVS
ncbi:MAG: radical SAM protein [Bacteroidetes bacterium]|nr:MAG: radical SAM protein [Bacteroidota bacterium]